MTNLGDMKFYGKKTTLTANVPGVLLSLASLVALATGHYILAYVLLALGQFRIAVR